MLLEHDCGRREHTAVVAGTSFSFSLTQPVTNPNLLQLFFSETNLE